MNARVVLFYGMGGALVEWWANGLRLLQKRFQAQGVQCLLIDWSQRQTAYNFMHGFHGFRAYAGASLGGGSAAEYPGDLDSPVDYAAGFQPSMDDARAHDGLITVAPQVSKAHCIFDPYWRDTLGLGQAQYRISPGAKTVLTLTPQRSTHPDDWGSAQTMIFDEAISLIKESQQ